ncbi:FAD:protein FMN transferase [Thermodesulfobacteriota bacterium]
MMKSTLRSTLFSIAISFAAAASSAAAGERPAPTEPIYRTRPMMGTEVTITAAPSRLDESEILACMDEAFTEIERIESIMSKYLPASEISVANREAGSKPVKISSELAGLIRLGLEISRLSDGAFDISFAGMSRIWDFGNPAGPLPSAGEAAAAVKHVDYRKIVLAGDGRPTISFQDPEMKLGLGAIAKGYAVDRALARLRRCGISDAIVNAGGDLKASGRCGDRPWRIGIQDPREMNDLVATVAVEDFAVVSSGDYERYFIRDGKRYHHILDPRTGMPAAGSSSMTVLHRSAARADALATALFVLGPDRGLALIDSIPGEAVIIDARGEITLSTGLAWGKDREIILRQEIGASLR